MGKLNPAPKENKTTPKTPPSTTTSPTPPPTPSSPHLAPSAASFRGDKCTSVSRSLGIEVMPWEMASWNSIAWGKGIRTPIVTKEHVGMAQNVGLSLCFHLQKCRVGYHLWSHSHVDIPEPARNLVSLEGSKPACLRLKPGGHKSRRKHFPGGRPHNHIMALVTLRQFH